MSARPFARPLAVLAVAALAAAPASAFELPARTRTTLKNGLTVVVMPTNRLPLVDFRLVARAGAVHDPAGREGLASLTADLLTQGAGKRTATQIAEDIAFVGGELQATASSEQLVVTCEVLTKDFATGLEMFRDVIVSPTFAAEEFGRKKEEAIGAIASSKDDPGTVANNALLPFLMGESPLAHPPLGWEKSVSAITRDDVVAFHRSHVTPDNAILAVVGDVNPATVVKDLERAFANWKRSGGAPVASYGAVKGGGRAVRIVNKPEVTQTQIRLAGGGVPRSHPDYFAIQVANTILGSGFTSRLVDEIRVNQGLTYSIRSGFTMYREAGTFQITTFTKNETIRKTVDETMKVVARLVSEGPSAEELAKAKRYLTGLYPLGLQAPDDMAAQLLSVEFYGLDPKYIETYSDRINGVSMDDCTRVLKTYFGPDALRILVVSDPEVARAQLEGLGPIDVTEIP
jgi:zinc protease